MINGFYLDESGNTGFGDMLHQPVVCYGGILVPNANVIELERNFESLSYQVSLQIKDAIKGLTSKEMDTLPFFVDYEIHSKAFFQGDSLFSKISIEDRLGLGEKILALLPKHGCKVFASVIDKHSYKQKTGDTHHTKMHQLAMSRLINLVETELIYRNETGLVIPDSGREGEKELLIQVIRQETASGRIYNNSFHQNSHHCSLVQLADIVVFLTTIFYRFHFGHTSRKENNTKLIDLYVKGIFSLSPAIWEYN